MRDAIKVIGWLSEAQLESWLKEATSPFEYQRRFAVSLASRFHYPASTLASMLFVDEKTVRRWIHEFNVGGPSSLGPDARGGRRRGFLDPDEEEDLLLSLHERASKGEFVMIQQIRADVEARIGHSVSKRYLLDLVHRHGWRKLVPRPSHPTGDPVLQAEYKKAFPDLLRRLVRAARTTLPIRILFEDEATFGRISEVYSSWAPPHVRPLVAKQQVRQFIHVLGASCPFDGKTVSALSETLDNVVITQFLRRIAARFPNEYCIVFMDGSGPHTAKALQVPARIQVERIPPKSPELNPEEHIWDHIREKHFGNRFFASMMGVIIELNYALQALTRHPKLVQSMTAFPWILNRTF